MRLECDCEEFKTWNEFEQRAVTVAWTHGILYPEDGPKFKFCGFCGAELIDRDKANERTVRFCEKHGVYFDAMESCYLCRMHGGDTKEQP